MGDGVEGSCTSSRSTPPLPPPAGPRPSSDPHPGRAVLASSRGWTLYYYTEDKPHSGKSACTGGCATAWPPLAAPVKAPAGCPPARLARRITRPNGVKQVTLNGYPLYFYAGDRSPARPKATA